MNTKTKLIAGLAIALVVSGCTTKTEFGPCIGAFDDKDPRLVYKVSAMNLVLAVVGFELIAPPIIVAVDETLCPIGRK